MVSLLTPNVVLKSSPAEAAKSVYSHNFPKTNHPRRQRVLLSSVFGPYAQDDEYGSRTMNPMELWHNQVTRVQGPFSLRMFHRSWGLMLIQANIESPCTCLDFPTRERFVRELQDHDYDIVGISAIMPNLLKLKEMCRLIRKHQPKATIVVGGHISNLSDLAERIEVDHVVRGDGVRWMREFLGEDTDKAIRHPQISSGLNSRCFGISLPFDPQYAATLLPSAGCPVGCNFCSTSAMFGGKGKCVEFYKSAEELFAVMCQLEEAMKTQSFFVMDENFLLKKDRALKLLELMEKNDKPWVLYVFSSAKAIQQYTMEQIVGLGISWLWLGLEGKNSQYGKLNGVDTRKLVRELQAHGIRVLGSSIIGLEEHTPENIDKSIEYAVSHNTDFHQFMLYTPIPGTPLHAEHQAKGTLLGEDEISQADVHGQAAFNFRHPHIRDGQEGEFILRAFLRDFNTNGPSIVRMVRTVLNGYQRYGLGGDSRIRRRILLEAKGLWTFFAASVWATRKWFADNPGVSQRMDKLLADLYREFGWKVRLAAPIVGLVIYYAMKREDRLLRNGRTYEPPQYYENNFKSLGYKSNGIAQAKWVSGLIKKPLAV